MYNECENLCNEIIATNKYRLDGDYSLPFSTNNELSNETMFVIPFDETKSGGQIYMWARKNFYTILKCKLSISKPLGLMVGASEFLLSLITI